MSVKSYAASSPGAPLVPFSFERRDVGPADVLIEITYCGICHSDIHSVRNEWSQGHYPMVPGHEIVGRVLRVGSEVRRFRPSDRVGVGCFVDSCRACASCRAGEENYCDHGPLFTYNSLDAQGRHTRGGYSSHIVVDENYVLGLPPGLPDDRAAPLLCAGITTYSPLKRWGVKKGDRLGVVGLGGLGHMAVKFGVALGAEVTVISSSPSKKADALALGAIEFLHGTDSTRWKAWEGRLDCVVDTVSSSHDMDVLLGLLRKEGTLVVVGAPGTPVPVTTFSLIMGRKNMTGSLIGGIRETQSMLDYCAASGVLPEVEVIPVTDVNKAYERVVEGRVRYRFVLDMKTL